MRTFIAIDLPSEVTDALEQLQDQLPLGRRAAHGTLHLTLAFLGDQREDALEQVHLGLSELQADRFSIELRGLDTFGGRQARILYADVVPDPKLSALQRSVSGAVRAAGLSLDRKRFRPHVTLARFPHRLSAEEEVKLAQFLQNHAGFGMEPFGVVEFVLFNSTLTPAGAVHEPLCRYALN